MILDTSCFKWLEAPDARDRFRANLDIADLEASPSEVNLVEAVAAPDIVQARLLRTIDEIRQQKPLLPWPFRLLKLVGQAILDGDLFVRTGETGYEWILEVPPELGDERAKVLPFAAELERNYRDVHRGFRKRLQPLLKKHDLRHEWSCAADFLERQWIGEHMRDVVAELTWTAIGLRGEAPLEALYANEAWTLFLDGEGVAIYNSSVAHEQRPATHRKDLIQLVYLPAAAKRIIATADDAFLDAAQSVLVGRYRNARAVHIQSLLS